MIIVTLVATLAASMVWQQWRAVQVEAAERARVQSGWMLAGALDWARLILRESAKQNQPIWIDDQWAKPLEEARLSTFLAADANNTDDAPDVFLSGDIVDAQGRFNLGNLVKEDNTPDNNQVFVLGHLCTILGLSDSVADDLARRVSNAKISPAPANAPLLPLKISQLSWLGISPYTIQTLEPYVVLLTDGTKLVTSKVNVNTASREVLAASLNVDAASAGRVIEKRKRGAFRTAADYTDLITVQPIPQSITLPAIDFTSDWFIVRGRLRMADRMLEERSLVHRNANTPAKFDAVQRERVASREATGN